MNRKILTGLILGISLLSLVGCSKDKGLTAGEALLKSEEYMNSVNSMSYSVTVNLKLEDSSIIENSPWGTQGFIRTVDSEWVKKDGSSSYHIVMDIGEKALLTDMYSYDYLNNNGESDLSLANVTLSKLDNGTQEYEYNFVCYDWFYPPAENIFRIYNTLSTGYSSCSYSKETEYEGYNNVFVVNSHYTGYKAMEIMQGISDFAISPITMRHSMLELELDIVTVFDSKTLKPLRMIVTPQGFKDLSYFGYPEDKFNDGGLRNFKVEEFSFDITFNSFNDLDIVSVPKNLIDWKDMVDTTKLRCQRYYRWRLFELELGWLRYGK